MKRGLIPAELKRLREVNVFTPNVHGEWMEEENERSFIEWCRKEEVKETMPADSIVDTNFSIYRMLTALIP